MSRPFVSVVIPTHDRTALLRAALDSVARQTFRDFEAIVVDDGSTEDVAAAVTDHPARPRIVRQERRGPAAARNRGVAEASAETVAFLDSDDAWLPDKLSRFLAAAREAAEVPIWYGPMRPVDSAGREVPGRTKDCRAGRITPWLFESSFVHVPTVVCRRSLLEEFGGFDEQLPVCEDYDLWLRLSAVHEFGLVPEPLALRGLHPGRLSKSCMARNLAVKAAVLERFYARYGGDGLLDPAAARRRLARVLLAAARAALRERFFARAVDLARRAESYGASRLRARAKILLARLLSWADRDRAGDRKPAPFAAANWPRQGLPLPRGR